MIGLGAKDNGQMAVDLVERTGTYSFPMYWDETFESWVSLGVTGQPAAEVLSASGDELGRWGSGFDFDEILSLATA